MIEACTRKEKKETISVGLAERSVLTLAFYKNDSETIAQFELGLKWAFSFLGASLEQGSWQSAVKWKDNSFFQLDIDQLGFNQQARDYLKELLDQFKLSEEYQVNGAIDASRFVMCVLNNSNHYYKITGISTSLQEFRSKYNFQDKKAGIVESGVAFTERLIELPDRDDNISSLAYLANELSGSMLDSTHSTVESEVMDIMENGQIRFGVYNTNGELIVGADPRFSTAGKPIKCLWCHEINLQRGFAAITAIPGYYSPTQFDSVIADNRTILDKYRANLNPEIDYADRLQHAELEKLYFRFAEPSQKRLAAEWNMSISEVNLLLVGIPTHRHHEFPFDVDLYYRSEIQQFSPYKVLPSTPSVRETNENEPNLLGN